MIKRSKLTTPARCLLMLRTVGGKKRQLLSLMPLQPLVAQQAMASIRF